MSRIVLILSCLVFSSCISYSQKSMIQQDNRPKSATSHNEQAYRKSHKMITANFDVYEYAIISEDIQIGIKLTNYNAYLSFKIADSVKNNYIPINLNSISNKSLKHISSITQVFRQSHSNEGAFVFQSSQIIYPSYTALLFNNSGIYYAYDFEVLEPECNEFDSIRFSDIPYKKIYVNQQQKKCDVRLTYYSSIEEKKSKDSNTHPFWNGEYYYNTYRTNEKTGTGIGAMTTVTISGDKCFIDIVGHQANNHFECYLKNSSSQKVDIIAKRDHSKFATIKRTKANKYSINISYYDKHSFEKEVDNTFYSIEKKQ